MNRPGNLVPLSLLALALLAVAGYFVFSRRAEPVIDEGLANQSSAKPDAGAPIGVLGKDAKNEAKAEPAKEK